MDEWIRSGQGDLARQGIRRLTPENLTRPERLQLASLARRVSLPEIGIRLLRPIVRPPGRRATQATDGERAEYAADLIRIGASTEALQLLDGVDTSRAPEALLFRAFGFIAQWNYAEAIEPLNRYVHAPALTDYQRLVGLTNLATSLFCESRHEESSRIAETLLHETEARGLSLLHGTVLELSAQNAIYASQWREAEKFLKLASGSLADSAALEAFFVRKWRAVMKLLRRGPGREALQGLDRIRTEGAKLQHWETVRDCDLFRAAATEDETQAVHLYFGTPFPGFRKRILAEFARPIEIPESYVWTGTRPLDATGGVSLDLVEPDSDGLKPGQLLHRLLLALSSDFYQPARLAALHATLFPGEHFHPVYSPGKMHQAMKRLRAFLASHAREIVLEEQFGRYRLVFGAGSASALRLPLQKPGGTVDARLLKLRVRFDDSAFSAGDAAAVLGVSPRMAVRALTSAVSTNALSRQGRGRATFYRF
jgi:hypothetical protein